MDDFNIDITEALNMAARIAQTAIDIQIPVKTGKLKAGIKILVENESLILYSEEDYGAYTEYGTGKYYKGNYGEGWDAGLFAGYSKGEGGIKAQKWSSLPIETETEIALMIEDEINRQVDIAIDKAIKEFSI